MAAPDAVTDDVAILRAELERKEAELRKKDIELKRKDIELKSKDLDLQAAHAQAEIERADREVERLRQARTGVSGAVFPPHGGAANESTATRQGEPSTRPPAPEPAPPQVVAPTHTASAAIKKKKKKRKGVVKAYNAYMKDALVGYKDEHPGVAHTDAFKAVAEKWKTMDENEKQAFQIQADAMNAQAAEAAAASAAAEAPPPEDDIAEPAPSAAATKSVARTPSGGVQGTSDSSGKAKRITPYNAYMKDVLAGYKDEHPGVAHTDAFKAVAEKWKTMDENEKQAYQIQADAMNAKAATDGRKKRKQRMTPYNAYLKDVLAGYKSKHPGVTHTDAFKAVTEKWKTMDENEKQAYQIRADAKKSKRPKKKSAYDIFRKEFDHEGYKAKHPDASKGDRLRFIIAAWQETSDAEKQAYKDKAAAQNAADQDPAADDDEAAKAMQPGPSTSSPPSA